MFSSKSGSFILLLALLSGVCVVGNSTEDLGLQQSKRILMVSPIRDTVMACADTVIFPEITPVFSSADSALFSATISYNPSYCSGLHFRSFITRSEISADFNPVFEGADSSFTFGNTGSDLYVYNIARNNMVDQSMYDFGGKMYLYNDPSDESSSIGTGNEAGFVVTVISPDADKCSQQIDFPDIFPGGQPITLSYPTSDLRNFQTRVVFSAEGVCGPEQYLDLILIYSEGGSIACSRVRPSAYGGQEVVTCSVPVGEMPTSGTWRLESTQPDLVSRASDPDMLYLTTIPTFTVTHPDEPQATGDLRRRQRQVQAGLIIPSDVQCKLGHEACPVPGRLGTWECLDTANLLDACGGCPHSRGKDCTSMPGVARVKCQVGRCVVQECDELHTLTRDRRGCVPRTNSIRWSAI